MIEGSPAGSCQMRVKHVAQVLDHGAAAFGGFSVGQGVFNAFRQDEVHSPGEYPNRVRLAGFPLTIPAVAGVDRTRLGVEKVTDGAALAASGDGEGGQQHQ